MIVGGWVVEQEWSRGSSPRELLGVAIAHGRFETHVAAADDAVAHGLATVNGGAAAQPVESPQPMESQQPMEPTEPPLPLEALHMEPKKSPWSPWSRSSRNPWSRRSPSAAVLARAVAAQAQSRAFDRVRSGDGAPFGGRTRRPADGGGERHSELWHLVAGADAAPGHWRGVPLADAAAEVLVEQREVVRCGDPQGFSSAPSGRFSRRSTGRSLGSAQASHVGEIRCHGGRLSVRRPM